MYIIGIIIIKRENLLTHKFYYKTLTKSFLLDCVDCQDCSNFDAHYYYKYAHI